MKLSFLLFASSFLLSSSPAAAAAAFRPTQIPVDSLLDDQAFTQSQNSFWDALSQVGMLSITNIQGLDPKETMKSLHPASPHPPPVKLRSFKMAHIASPLLHTLFQVQEACKTLLSLMMRKI